MAKKIKDTKPFVWLICYIDSEQVKNVERDLNKKTKYKEVESYIPMVKILSKQFKGRPIFDYVPLLFNYGFFKVSLENARNREFLSNMKEDIGCIYGWVKDEMKRSKGSEFSGISVAVARPSEIVNLVRAQANTSIYSSDDLNRIKPGMYVTLRGYPFDNINAQIKSIDFKKEEVKVSLQLDSVMKDVRVSFNNVFYSIYNGGFDEEKFTEKSLDEMKSKNNGTLDKLFSKLCRD
jgi:transcription antitermination factor NusG